MSYNIVVVLFIVIVVVTNIWNKNSMEVEPSYNGLSPLAHPSNDIDIKKRDAGNQERFIFRTLFGCISFQINILYYYSTSPYYLPVFLLLSYPVLSSLLTN